MTRITETLPIPWDVAMSALNRIIDDHNHSAQDALLMALMLYSGRRISDVKQLQWEDVAADRFPIREGKTKKVHWITIPSNLRKILDKYRQPEGYILHRKKGAGSDGTKQLSVRGCNIRLKEICHKYGIETPANNSTHFLRKTFATHVTEEHGIEAASEILNHSSLRMTRKYIGDRSERLSSIYEKL